MGEGIGEKGTRNSSQENKRLKVHNQNGWILQERATKRGATSPQAEEV